MHSVFAEHLAQVVRAQVEVFVAVELVKKFPHHKLVLAALSLLDKLVPEGLNCVFDLLLVDLRYLLVGVVPLAADIPEEDIVMSKVDIEVVIEGHKLLF